MKKVIISPTDAKAIAFFTEIEKRKEERRKKAETKLKEIAKLIKKSNSAGN